MLEKKLKNETFIEKARKVHGDKYDYSKVDYINNRTPVIIICPKHGEFKQIPKTHLKGHGCRKCTLEWLSKRYISNKDEFIKKARKVHGDKYDYSKVEYNGDKKEVCIICPEHGEFWQTPNSHLRGHGCYECGREKNSKSKFLNTDTFIQKAKEIHGKMKITGLI